MGRSGKKGPAGKPGTDRPEPAAPAHAAAPSPKNPAPAPRNGASTPRATTDNPWRDLHPTRVWPD